jgi:hypothetical protein
MSAELAVRAAVLSALRGDAALMGLTNGMYDGPPVKASEPYALVGEAIGSDWGTKDAEGREVRIALSLFDRQETPVRLGEMMGLAHAAVRAMGGMADGWRIAGVALVRSRTAGAREPGRDGGWSAVADYRVRVMRE